MTDYERNKYELERNELRAALVEALNNWEDCEVDNYGDPLKGTKYSDPRITEMRTKFGLGRGRDESRGH